MFQTAVLQTAAVAAANTSAGDYVLTDAGLVFDLKAAAGGSGSCNTVWQLIEMSPNLTTLADTIEARMH